MITNSAVEGPICLDRLHPSSLHEYKQAVALKPSLIAMSSQKSEFFSIMLPHVR